MIRKTFYVAGETSAALGFLPYAFMLNLWAAALYLAAFYCWDRLRTAVKP